MLRVERSKKGGLIRNRNLNFERDQAQFVLKHSLRVLVTRSERTFSNTGRILVVGYLYGLNFWLVYLIINSFPKVLISSQLATNRT